MGELMAMGMPTLILLVILAIMVVVSIIESIVLGALVGAAPLICGLNIADKKKLGIIGFIVCIATYVVFGLFFALIASLIFTYLIVKANKKAEPAVEEIEEPATEE